MIPPIDNKIPGSMKFGGPRFGNIPPIPDVEYPENSNNKASKSNTVPTSSNRSASHPSTQMVNSSNQTIENNAPNQSAKELVKQARKLTSKTSHITREEIFAGVPKPNLLQKN